MVRLIFAKALPDSIEDTADIPRPRVVAMLPCVKDKSLRLVRMMWLNHSAVMSILLG
ncbi:MAG: hypothetical protein PHR78_04305 [Eubacteriales bacterium]|nr:hypothetical protein [Eubacteriales bacterium]MDD4323523.1 hypothetical protein [Eubacteriales bacterium]MDD4541369.1 hypothetical protein [Eubacteriales bacterium]